MPNNQIISKARMLEILGKQQRGFIVDPFLTFTVEEWRRSPGQIIDRLRRGKLGPIVIVRSAVITEDMDPNVPPGTYHSEANVQTSSKDSLSTAIEKVIASYVRHTCDAETAKLDEVLVQHQALNPLLSGLVMSHDYNSSAPYFLVEYDDETGRTDRVTGGHFCKKASIFRSGIKIPPPWDLIIKATRSIEKLLGFNSIVIEFALTRDGAVHVFQVRQMPVSYQNPGNSETGASYLIRRSKRFIGQHSSAVWSNMADWNPAEMLGEHPKPLDTSLYKYLITQSTWAQARASLGYKDVRPRKLMNDIAGYPYINAEVSFESLCPASLPGPISQRLVANRIAFLCERPELHDKAELEIMFTCADVVRPPRTRFLLQSGFSKSEVDLVEKALTLLTSAFLTDKRTILKEDLQRREVLMKWLEDSPSLIGKSIDPSIKLEYIANGLKNCRDLGTYSFARLARLAFVGRDLLARLVISGAFTLAEYERFWKSVDTVAWRVTRAIRDLSRGRVSKSEFDREFGHLRPRTYDITSRRYDQSEFVLPDASQKEVIIDEQPLRLLPHTHSRISIGLSLARLPSDSQEFLNYVSVFIREREKSKFEFSAVLSACLETIADVGGGLGLDRTELSFLTVTDILEARAMQLKARKDLKLFWTDKINWRKAKWEEAENIRLPSVILSSDDLNVVRPTKSQPNFITSRHAAGQIIVIENNLPQSGIDLSHKIVVMEAADPGFDWIFSHPIAALVTKYGGAASHMAIRTAQFGIPAIIGCGEELYCEFCSHRRAIIDCRQGRVEFPD
jgi:glutamine kinase